MLVWNSTVSDHSIFIAIVQNMFHNIQGWVSWKIIHDIFVINTKVFKNISFTVENKKVRKDISVIPWAWACIFGPSIKDVSPEGEGGGYPQKQMLGDGRRDRIYAKGDVFFLLLKWWKRLHFYRSSRANDMNNFESNNWHLCILLKVFFL